MKKNSWNIDSKTAKKCGSPVDTKTLQVYRQNFEKALDNTQGELAKAFKSDQRNRAAEFMGRETFLSLLDAADRAVGEGNQCVGIRTYYGLAYEELIEAPSSESKLSTKPLREEILRPRLFIVAVDQHGRDIEIDLSQLKDPGGSGWGNGMPMPPYGES